MKEAVEAAALDYLRVGRWAAGFARGKLSADPVYAAVLAELGDRGRLVDAGCGEGYLLALVRQLKPGLELLGVDHDERRVAVGRRALAGRARLTLVAGDLREVDLPRTRYCACLDVLHYMTFEQQDATLCRLAGILEPGGVLLVRDGAPGPGWRPALTRLSEQLLVALGRHRGDGVFLRPTEALQAALEDCGLDVEARPCQAGTPFANVLLIARRAP